MVSAHLSTAQDRLYWEEVKPHVSLIHSRNTEWEDLYGLVHRPQTTIDWELRTGTIEYSNREHLFKQKLVRPCASRHPFDRRLH